MIETFRWTAKEILPLKQADWLLKAIEILRGDFERIGEIFPEVILIRVEYPNSNIAYSWLGTYRWYYDDRHSIFVNPSSDGLAALDILVHELVHAVGIPDHGEQFHRVAAAIGMSGGGITACAEKVLLKRLREIQMTLGSYPLITDCLEMV